MDMQHYAVEHYITGSQLMLEYNEQVCLSTPALAVFFSLDSLRLKTHTLAPAIYFLITFCSLCESWGVASLCKEMNLQGKANGRKVVVFGKVQNL